MGGGGGRGGGGGDGDDEGCRLGVWLYESGLYCCGGSVMTWVMICVPALISQPFVVFQDREHRGFVRRTIRVVRLSTQSILGNSRMLGGLTVQGPRILTVSWLVKTQACPVRLWHPLGFGQFLSGVCFCSWELKFLAGQTQPPGPCLIMQTTNIGSTCCPHSINNFPNITK